MLINIIALQAKATKTGIFLFFFRLGGGPVLFIIIPSYYNLVFMLMQTADQFFSLNLPVNITHLQALLSVVIHSLDAYLTKIIDQLGIEFMTK